MIIIKFSATNGAKGKQSDHVEKSKSSDAVLVNASEEVNKIHL